MQETKLERQNPSSVWSSQASSPQGIQPPKLEDSDGQHNKPPII